MKRAIINGKYYQNPNEDELSQQRRHGDGAEYRRTLDRDRHYKDMIQPFIGNKPNREFIKAYPDRAKDYFTDEELKNI